MFIKNTQSPAAHFHASAQQPSDHSHKFWGLTLGCIGVVYGDIGTSPIYAFREAMSRLGEGVAPAAPDIFGIISLIIWALTVVVTLKYILFLLYADNRGEGGMLSLTALAQKSLRSSSGIVFFLGILGAALFYGDAAITPAISVLSAVEGLELVAPHMEPYVLPLAIVILIGLFVLQKRGTGNVSALFGPVTAVWFVILGLAGLVRIFDHPAILWAFSPHHAVLFLLAHKTMSLAVLGAVFLAITGAEALYEDLGHFGRRPIQAAWLFLIFPCLALNYLGQGALLIKNPEAISDPFFLMVPHWALLPLVIMATVATIIASQAVITGTYSLTRSAIQLGLLPRMEIKHTSEAHAGQIYMPKVNRFLMWAVLFLIVIFRSSSSLAHAYGIAVTGTFLVTSALVFIVVWKTWDRSPLFAACLVLPFVVIETVFLLANAMKLFEGGIVPLMMAAFLVLLMTIWVRGSRYLMVRTRRQTMPLRDLIDSFRESPPHRSPGTAIFLTGDSQSAPIALIQNLKHNKVLHEQNIILTVVTSRVPKVAESQRIVVERLAPYMTSVILHFGYSEIPDVPRALALAPNLNIDLKDVSYFLGRRTLIPDSRRGLPEWQDHLFIPMARAAATATDFFRLPPGKVVELGVQIAV